MFNKKCGRLILKDVNTKKNTIGTLNESSLHRSLKEYYFTEGDLFEQKLDGYFIDILRGDTLIEIQTSNFYTIKRKLKNLLSSYSVRLVFPIAENKYIVKMDPKTGEIESRRKSPKKGQITDLFDELMRLPEMINNKNFSLEVILIDLDEIRCDDGKGSWRRKGVSIIDRKLTKIHKSFVFNNGDDFISMFNGLDTNSFTNKDLSLHLNIPTYKARRITWTLKKAGLLVESGKKRNEIIYMVKGE